MPEIFSLLGMLLVVAAVLALAYFVTRYLGGRGMGLPSGGPRGAHMRVVDQLPLGREQRLALVRVGGRWLLLGVSPGAIQLLAELSEEEAALWQSEPGPGQTDGGTPLPSFREAFLESLRRKK